MTTAGIYGFVTAIEGDVIWLEIAEGVEIRIARQAASPQPDPAGGAPTRPSDASTDAGADERRRRGAESADEHAQGGARTLRRRLTGDEAPRPHRLARRHRRGGDRGRDRHLRRRHQARSWASTSRAARRSSLQPVGEADDESLTVVTDILRNRIDGLGRGRAGDHPPGRHRRREPARRQGPGPGHRARRPDRRAAASAPCWPRRLPTRRGRRRPPCRRATTTVPGVDHGAGATTTGRHHDVDDEHVGRPRRRPRRRRPAGGRRPRRLAPEVASARSPPRAEDTPEATVVAARPGRHRRCYTPGPGLRAGRGRHLHGRGHGVQRRVGGRPGAEGRRERPRHLEHLVGASASTGRPTCPTGGMAIVLDGDGHRRSRPADAVLRRHQRRRSPAAATASARPRPRTWPWCSGTARCRSSSSHRPCRPCRPPSGRTRCGPASSPASSASPWSLILHDPLLPQPGLLVVLAGWSSPAACSGRRSPSSSKTSGLSLTLAGATGIIVSIGVTVDSYVVYFERLKDDVRVGQVAAGVDAPRASRAAYRTILAADIVSLIGAGVLWYLTVGSVRGFAFFLGLSTMLDLIVAYFFTRPAAHPASRRRGCYRGGRGARRRAPARPAGRGHGVTAVEQPHADAGPARPDKRSLWHRLYHGETTFDFVGKRRIGFIISGVLIVLSAWSRWSSTASTSASTSRAAWPGRSSANGADRRRRPGRAGGQRHRRRRRQDPDAARAPAASASASRSATSPTRSSRGAAGLRRGRRRRPSRT